MAHDGLGVINGWVLDALDKVKWGASGNTSIIGVELSWEIAPWLESQAGRMIAKAQIMAESDLDMVKFPFNYGKDI